MDELAVILWVIAAAIVVSEVVAVIKERRGPPKK